MVRLPWPKNKVVNQWKMITLKGSNMFASHHSYDNYSLHFIPHEVEMNGYRNSCTSWYKKKIILRRLNCDASLFLSIWRERPYTIKIKRWLNFFLNHGPAYSKKLAYFFYTVSSMQLHPWYLDNCSLLSFCFTHSVENI